MDITQLNTEGFSVEECQAIITNARVSREKRAATAAKKRAEFEAWEAANPEEAAAKREEKRLEQQMRNKKRAEENKALREFLADHRTEDGRIVINGQEVHLPG